MTISAVVLLDHTIAAVIVADAAVDDVPPGYPEGAVLLVAPEGCNETWTYSPDTGFTPPKIAAPTEASSNRVDF